MREFKLDTTSAWPESPEVSALPDERLLRQQDARHRVVERRQLVRKFRQALALNELSLYFRPVVRLSTRALYGVEAQLRLHHARRGLIPAEHLVARLESAELVADISRWMLRTLVQQMDFLPAEMAVAMAVAPSYLHGVGLSDHLFKCLHQSGIEPSRLHLLVPESVLVKETKNAEFNLKIAKNLGVKLVLDNFGADYGGLVSLKRFGFSALRLNRDLALRLEDGDKAMAQIEAAVTVGQVVGCDIWADGIDDKRGYERLSHAGIDAAQGMFLGDAAPIQEFAGLTSEARNKMQ